ncbi:hypothetical protein ZIOFF_036877 [Zingiber officinale]|uniref:BHLH domain-containing protein n=1 Tax=Zingiber officinale TaxID=94328 RepID=A0A8J5GAY1_ZINOF|nr:hypothetical protein ZIOFF_036877 [Zingiber officinale]
MASRVCFNALEDICILDDAALLPGIEFCRDVERDRLPFYLSFTWLSLAGNGEAWLQNSNTVSAKQERLNCASDFFDSLQDHYSDINTGLHSKAIGEPRKRLTTRDLENKHQVTLNTSYQSKRLKTSYSRQQRSTTIPGIMPLSKLPMRRSQKLGDKITALQQLVSPFGKACETDTASVLQEAALSIKFLHEQIKGHAESSSSSGDLPNRGLCLVPIFTILGLDLMDQTPCGGGAAGRTKQTTDHRDS